MKKATKKTSWEQGLVDKIEKNLYGSGVVLYPVHSGGSSTEYLLLDEFGRRGILYDHLSVRYDKERMRILYPSTEEILKIKRGMEEEIHSIKHLIWDDSIITGATALSVYDYLLSTGIEDPDIMLAAVMDNVGISGGLYVQKTPSYGPVARHEILAQLKSEGKIPLIPSYYEDPSKNGNRADGDKSGTKNFLLLYNSMKRAE